MSQLPDTQQFHDLANRIIWFEPSDIALRDISRFMAYAFRYATYDDMQLLRTQLSDDDLRSALATAPPGIIDPRSWSYWHAILGTFPAPPQIGRRFLFADDGVDQGV